MRDDELSPSVTPVDAGGDRVEVVCPQKDDAASPSHQVHEDWQVKEIRAGSQAGLGG